MAAAAPLDEDWWRSHATGVDLSVWRAINQMSQAQFQEVMAICSKREEEVLEGAAAAAAAAIESDSSNSGDDERNGEVVGPRSPRNAHAAAAAAAIESDGSDSGDDERNREVVGPPQSPRNAHGPPQPDPPQPPQPPPQPPPVNNLNNNAHHARFRGGLCMFCEAVEPEGANRSPSGCWVNELQQSIREGLQGVIWEGTEDFDPYEQYRMDDMLKARLMSNGSDLPENWAACQNIQKRYIFYYYCFKMIYGVGRAGERKPIPVCVKTEIMAQYPRNQGA